MVSANEHVLYLHLGNLFAFFKNESLLMQKSLEAKIDKNSCSEINTAVVNNNCCYWADIYICD
jgi:hypothetical protein